jgi:hypothetical protein
MTTSGLILSLLTSAAMLALGAFAADRPLLAIFPAVLAVTWLAAMRFGWRWFPGFGLATFLILAAVGIWMDLSAIWMLAAGITALLAWDLSNFWFRMLVLEDEDRKQAERSHLLRLGLAGTIGAALGAGPLLIRPHLTFQWGVILAIIAFIGISFLVRWLIHQK